MPRQEPVKLTLDKLDINPVRNEEMAREAMPLFPNAKCQIEFFHRREVHRGRLFHVPVGWWGREETCDVQHAWEFDELEVVHHFERRVVVVGPRKDA